MPAPRSSRGTQLKPDAFIGTELFTLPSMPSVQGGNVIAPSRSQAKRLAEDAYGRGSVVRHEAHEGRGFRNHDQPSKRRDQQKTDHIFYGKPNAQNILITQGTLGALTAAEVEAATSSEMLGNIAELAVDQINPAADILSLKKLFEEIGTDLIEVYYDVDIEFDASNSQILP